MRLAILIGIRYAVGQRANPFLTNWCKTLKVAQPPLQPCWGAGELARRRRAARNITLMGSMEVGDIDTSLQIAATSQGGTPIFTSEGGQDRWLWKHHFRFFDRPPIYADFGANDPIFTSNTFFLDRCIGAQGLCVEANPRFFARYDALRSCSLTRTCLSEVEVDLVFAFQNKDFSTRSGILVDNKSYRKGRGANGHTDITLRCVTGASVFAAAGITHVDLLDLDAEGHELGILRGIDWGKVEIDIIQVEANNGGVVSFLSSLNYTRFGRIHYDDVYLRRGFQFQDPSASLIGDSTDACCRSRAKNCY